MILEMWLNSGLLGIAAFFLMIFTSFYHVNLMKDEDYKFVLVILAFLTMNGLTERCLGGNYDYKTLAVFLVMAMGCNSVSTRRREIRPYRPDEEETMPGPSPELS